MVSLEIGSHQFLICLTLNVRLHVEQGVPLQLGDDVGEDTAIQLDVVAGSEDVRIADLDLFEQRDDPFFEQTTLPRDGFAFLSDTL